MSLCHVSFCLRTGHLPCRELFLGYRSVFSRQVLLYRIVCQIQYIEYITAMELTENDVINVNSVTNLSQT